MRKETEPEVSYQATPLHGHAKHQGAGGDVSGDVQVPRPERSGGRHEGHDGNAAAATAAEPGRHEVPWDGRRRPASGQRRGQPLCQTGTGEPVVGLRSSYS